MRSPPQATVAVERKAGCVCVDGRLSAPGDARVSALDAGLLLGDGVFESLRAVGGVPYLLERHLDRLLAGARRLGFTGLPAAGELFAQVARTLARADLPDAYVRVTVTRGSSVQALAPPRGPATTIVAALPAPPRSGEPLRVRLLGAAPAAGVRAKSTSRQHAVVARMSVEREGADEGLYVSADGSVLEGISSNLFVCVGGRLLTPPVEQCLPGITRARLLELARAAGMTAVERPLTVEELLGAEAAFLTNAVQGPRAICAVDGHAVGNDDRGELYRTLRELYECDRAQAAV